MTDETTRPVPPAAKSEPAAPSPPPTPTPPGKATETAVAEIGGPTGPEPTRYGDWERGGRCSDF